MEIKTRQQISLQRQHLIVVQQHIHLHTMQLLVTKYQLVQIVQEGIHL
jgi:hypothetical protein